MRRARAAGLALLVLSIALATIVLDASRRRAARDARMDAVVAITGLPDLALSSSARWLRHPSQAEPGAPFADAPASLDTDPAGAWIGPPRAVLEVGAIEVRRR